MGALSKTLPQLASSKLFITEGGIETSLIYRKNIDIPGFSTLPLLGTEEGRKTILSIYQDYVKIALAHSTGIVLETRTWRGSPAWSSTIGLSVTQIVDLNRIAVRILRDLRHKAETPSTPIVISGALGPLQDAYQDSTGRFTFSQAREHYGAQIRVFAEEGVDMSSIMTVTNLDEATAAVSVAREYNLPILVSFSIETDGRLRGGRTLEDAIREVDRVTDNYTTYFGVNCAHPRHVMIALRVSR
ncbi:Homocysteine S-methyltransferase, putative [Penicillium digitatum]|uniref:Homocysteine S-methyltransferase, putative n=1 Tax=Penicillium digitatum TaxID=36651 RepID=A0A7T6XUN3_PENDI|nr:Homocysteine S-methyltransferase, putative [Penicillium digitatum]